MNTKITLFATALVALCCFSLGEAVGYGGLISGMGPPVRGKLLWSQEFDYIGFPRKEDWEAEIGNGVDGWGNFELQYYTNRNAFVENGKLVITARKERYENFDYTSSRLISKQKFKYGVFEGRLKLPPGNGSWGAFWMMSSKKPLSWPLDGELDLMEHIGRTPGEVHVNVHLQKYNHINATGKGSMVKLDPATIYDDFHTYTVDWNEHRVKFYVDDEEIFMFRKLDESYEGWPFDNEMNILLNSAVGGLWPGNNIADELYPTRYEIDYVRQYEKNTIPEADPQLVSIKSVSQNKWLSIGNVAGGHVLVAYYDEPNYPETFEWVEKSGSTNGEFHLKSITTAQYLHVVPANGDVPISLMANAEKVPGPEGTFVVENGKIRMAGGAYWRTLYQDEWPQIVPDASEATDDASFQFELKMRRFF